MWDNSKMMFGQFVGWAVRPTLLPLKVGLRFAWPSLLLLVAMTGCAQYSPWSNAGPRPVVVSQADLATFNDAVSLAESLRYEEAAGKFQQVFDSFSIAGDRKRAAESLFWLGFCREKQHRSVEARAIYLRLAEEYAGTPAAHQADERLSRLSGGWRSPPAGRRR